MIKKSPKKLEFKLERTIPAAVEVVFDGWIDPKVPGNPWYEGDKCLLEPKVDGFFYWRIMGTPHYGRFTKFDRPARLEHTWVSPNTLGEESMVTVTFKKKGETTLMTLVHAGLPDNEEGRGHERGWTYFLGLFTERYAKPARKKK